MTQKYAVRFFSGKEGLRQLEKDWNVVFESLSKKRFYCRYEWYKCYLEALKPKGETLYFFVVYKKDKPVAIFPLRKCIKKVFGFKLKVWETPFHYHLVFSDVIYDINEKNRDILTFFIKYLSNNKVFKFDELIIYSVLVSSTLINSLRYNKSLLQMTKQTGTCSFFYAKDFNGKAKRKKSKSLNKKLKKLQQLGSVEFVWATAESDILRDFDTFMDVESSGWKGARGTAIKCNEELVRFYRCLITEFMNIGGCGIYLLKVGGECIAANFCIVDDDTIYSLKTGYREDYGQYSPGMICRDNFLSVVPEDENIKYINFVTHQVWHDRWNPLLRGIHDVYIFNISIGGIIVFMIEKGKQWIKKLLPRQGKD